MTPTTRFRYIERVVQIPITPMSNITKGEFVRILQQWWKVENITDAVHNNILDGEWRDIPLETEQ
jgi:hypothetical protein